VHRTCAFALLVATVGCGGDDGPSFAAEHPRIYLGSQRDRLVAALAADTPAARRFKESADRWLAGDDVYLFPAWNGALMSQLTGDDRYCTTAAAQIDAQVKAAEAAFTAGNAPEVAGDDYLQIGRLVGDLALTYDWCYAQVPSDRRKAWLSYANQAVFNVWNPDAAAWGGTPMPWDGWSIDNPSDNYYYSFLRATMLVGLAEKGENDYGDMWIAQFRDTKVLGELVPQFDADLVGGGSREGTGYGVALRSLFELYDFWDASTGESLATRTAHTRASMLAFIHATLPTLDRVAPTGDQSRDSTASFFDYHRNYLQELITLFPGDPVAPRAQALLAGSSVPEMTEQFMRVYDLLYANTDVTPSSLDGLNPVYYASGTGQLYARSGWDTHATWFNFIAGPYTQCHAHQDQGAIMLYKDGWLAYDPVVDSQSGLPQQVEAHSTVRLVAGGSTVEQQLGTSSKMLALHRGTGYVHAAGDLTPVYADAAGVQQVQREVVYLEPDVVVVYDRVKTASGTDQVWQLATPAAAQLAGAQAQVTASGHTLSIERVTPASGVSASVHSYTDDGDFNDGYRLDESLPAGDQRWLHVLSIDDAVTAMTSPDDATVSLTLKGGTTAEVRFQRDAVGGTLKLGSQTITLDAGVDTLPE